MQTIRLLQKIELTLNGVVVLFNEGLHSFEDGVLNAISAAGGVFEPGSQTDPAPDASVASAELSAPGPVDAPVVEANS